MLFLTTSPRRLALLLAVPLLVAAAPAAQRAAAAVQPPAGGGPPDAQMQAVLDELSSMNPKPIETLSPEEARKQPTPADAVKKLIAKQNKSADPIKVRDIDDERIKGPAGKIPLRVYEPQGEKPAAGWPVIVYYHGGGFVIATIDTYDGSCRALANITGAVVVAVEYRKAPENKYPAQVDDAFAAYQWVCANASEVDGDPSKIAVAGESAGGMVGPLRHPGGAVKCAVAAAVAAVERRSVSRGWTFILLSRR